VTRCDVAVGHRRFGGSCCHNLQSEVKGCWRNWMPIGFSINELLGWHERGWFSRPHRETRLFLQA